MIQKKTNLYFLSIVMKQLENNLQKKNTKNMISQVFVGKTKYFKIFL